MSAVYASPAQYRCSCGRTFLNGATLERHQWVTQHSVLIDKPHNLLPDPQAQVTQAAMAQAMRVLKQKQAEQNKYDKKRRQKRRLHRHVINFRVNLSDAVQTIARRLLQLASSLLTAGKIVFLLSFMMAGLMAGIKLGTFFPT